VFPDPALNVLWNSSKTGLQWPDPVSQLGQNSVINTQDRLVKGKIPTAADGDMESLVTSRWHLIIHQKSGEQLYDWTADPEIGRASCRERVDMCVVDGSGRKTVKR